MKILICDDSKIARKSLARNIKNTSEVNVFYAENGKEGLQTLSEHDIDVLFLDLTMPIMDGFEVLASLPVNSYQTHIIVVSADIQEKARQRCYELGAKEFIEKPFSNDVIQQVFKKYQIPLLNTAATSQTKRAKNSSSIDIISSIKEISNVALGASAALISEQFDRFIDMPLPNVATLHRSELKMVLQDIINNSEYRAISQRFVGYGINGEALVCLHGDNLKELLSVNDSGKNTTTNEAILDIANLLVSAFLLSFSKQLDIAISLRQPSVLNSDQLKTALKDNHQFLGEYEKDIFTIEFVYSAESMDLKCDVIFLMDNDSLSAIKSILESVL
ncbi:response regulator [Aliivibrio fischeri]